MWATEDEKSWHFQHDTISRAEMESIKEAYEEQIAECEMRAEQAYERHLEDRDRELDPEGYAREDYEYARGLANGEFSLGA